MSFVSELREERKTVPYSLKLQDCNFQLVPSAVERNTSNKLQLFLILADATYAQTWFLQQDQEPDLPLPDPDANHSPRSSSRTHCSTGFPFRSGCERGSGRQIPASSTAVISFLFAFLFCSEV